MSPPVVPTPEIGNRQRGLIDIRRAPRFSDHFHRAADWRLEASTLLVFFSGELTLAGANIKLALLGDEEVLDPIERRDQPGFVRREHLLHQRQQRRQHIVGLEPALGHAGFEELQERQLQPTHSSGHLRFGQHLRGLFLELAARRAPSL